LDRGVRLVRSALGRDHSHRASCLALSEGERLAALLPPPKEALPRLVPLRGPRLERHLGRKLRVSCAAPSKLLLDLEAAPRELSNKLLRRSLKLEPASLSPLRKPQRVGLGRKLGAVENASRHHVALEKRVEVDGRRRA